MEAMFMKITSRMSYCGSRSSFFSPKEWKEMKISNRFSILIKNGWFHTFSTYSLEMISANQDFIFRCNLSDSDPFEQIAWLRLISPKSRLLYSLIGKLKWPKPNKNCYGSTLPNVLCVFNSFAFRFHFAERLGFITKPLLRGNVI